MKPLHSSANPVFEIIATERQCSGGHCPTIYKKDDQTYLIQGYCADDFFSKDHIPEGEAVVSIPAAIVKSLFEKSQDDDTE